MVVKPLEKKDCLSHVGVLLIEPDNFLAQLIKNILISSGFARTYVVADSQEALDFLSEQAIDLIISEWDVGSVNGIDFIKHVRHLDDISQQRLPIIMNSGRAQYTNVLQARDAGANEFLVKPISVKSLLQRMQLAIEKPRDFVIAGNYVGPERRRRKEDTRWKAHERRAADAALQDNVKVLDADYSLLESVGGSDTLKSLFNAEVIAKAEESISKLNDDFLPWALEDFSEIERRFISLMENDIQKLTDIIELSKAALRIKSRAGTFGYHLASNVADLMYINISDRNKISGRWIKIFQAHIQALYVIFHQNVMDAGSDEGREIIEVLSNLIEAEKARETSEKKVVKLLLISSCFTHNIYHVTDNAHHRSG